MKKITWIYLLIICAEIFGTLFFIENAAAKTIPSSLFSQSKKIQTSQITGDVLRRNNNVLTIRTDTGTKQFSIPDGVKIKRNTLNANIADIQPNDQVIITQTSDGTVLSVDVTAGNVFDFTQWAIPLLVISILAVFIIWMLIKSANKSHIKTVVE